MKQKIQQIFNEQGFCGFQATYDEECERDFKCDDCPKDGEMVDSEITSNRVLGLVEDAKRQIQQILDAYERTIGLAYYQETYAIRVLPRKELLAVLDDEVPQS